MFSLEKFVKQNTALLSFICIGFVLRILYSFLPSFMIDMVTWLAWGERLDKLGPSNFYTDSLWTHYTPGYLYWLWLGGATNILSEAYIKIPTALADILVGTTLYFLIKKYWNTKAALIAFTLYVFNPAAIFNGSVWGQIDGLFSLFLFFSLYFVLEKKQFLLSSLFWSIALLIKPQALALLPPLIIASGATFGIKKTIMWIISSIVIVFIGAYPFFPHKFLGLPEMILQMANDYSYTSVFAYNIWTFLTGMWIPDSQTFLGTSYAVWGTIAYAIALGVSFIACFPFHKKYKFYLFSALSFFSFFLFPTKVHERYLFPVFPFLLASAFLAKNKTLIYLSVILMVIHFINLYYPYAYYMPDSILSNEVLKNAIGNSSPLLGVITLLLFGGVLFEKYLPQINLKNTFWDIKMTKEEKIIKKFNYTRRYLTFILIFAFLTRIINLWSPNTFYFDEVYHAFTAREIVNGNPQAWEYWATPPSGFAYEWTHPPLAKLVMAGSMIVLGENPFAWRLPEAIFGTLCVYLVFLLGKLIFKDEKIGLLAAFLFSLDGLVLVMSRIGMNDIYFLFFTLFSIYLFLKDKYFFSSIAWGLAISSKWTAFFVILIFGLSWILYKRKFSLQYFWFLLIPPAVYLASYTIFFVTGHSLLDLWHTQQQMWWYHTGLKATHPYSSPAWSWPFMLKPVWLYTNQELDLHQDIYIAGNPAIFYAGFISILWNIYFGIKNKKKGLIFISFSYLSMFAPWISSPRIMFLYHYTPAIPFLSLSLAYFLFNIFGQDKKAVKLYLGITILCFLLFFPFWAGIPIPDLWWRFHF